MNSLAIGFMLIMCILVVLLPRRYAAVPIIATACYTTYGEAIIIGGMHFYYIRVVMFFALVRVIARKEIQLIDFNSIDKIFILWVISNFMAYVILRQDSAAITNRLGFAYDAIGTYFIFRIFLVEPTNTDILIKSLGIIIAPVAIAMLFESQSGSSFFARFGGIPELSWVRDERVRCQGPFLHSILAGTFGATVLPLFLGQFISNQKNKYIAVLGVISATIITITAASGGPVAVYLFSILGLCMWFMRKHMRAIRWAILLALIGLHMVMKSPVWYLIARLGGITGGSSYHRAEIIEQAVKHLNEWWFLGTAYTAHWMPYTLTLYPDQADITNMYVGQGVTGGLLTMLLFIGIIVFCFRKLGYSVEILENQRFSSSFFVWSMGATLFSHVVAFFSVSYFDQSIVFYYMLLAMIAGTNSFLHLPQEQQIEADLE